MIFKPGDKVRWAFYGDRIFTLIGAPGGGGGNYPIGIRLPDEGVEWFTGDGRLEKHHTHPILTLVASAPEAPPPVPKADGSAVFIGQEYGTVFSLLFRFDRQTGDYLAHLETRVKELEEFVSHERDVRALKRYEGAACICKRREGGL